MIAGQIYADIVSMCVLTLLLVASLTKRGRKSNRSRLFISFIVVDAASLSIDMFVNFMDGVRGADLILSIANTILYLTSSVLAVLFAYYCVILINERKKTSFWFAHAVLVAASAGAIITIVEIVLGLVFTVENGVFIDGPVTAYSSMIAIAGIVYIMIFMVINKKYIGTRDALAIILYVAFPVAGTVVEVFYPILSSSFVGIAVSCLALYMLVQAKESSELRDNEEILREASTTDSLTGLKNRRAYMECMNCLSAGEEMGFVFSDINGLKKTNDTIGHEAGDKLIRTFASIEKAVFPKGTVYRIGGDEFVTVLHGLKQAEFEKLVAKFRERLIENDNIASFGSSYGKGEMAMTLMAEAEKEMYAEKRAYHESIDK